MVTVLKGRAMRASGLLVAAVLVAATVGCAAAQEPGSAAPSPTGSSASSSVDGDDSAGTGTVAADGSTPARAPSDPLMDAWWRAVVRPTTPAPPPEGDPAVFAGAQRAMEQRVRSAGLAGGVLRVVRDGHVLHESSVGGHDGRTRMSMASATKWFTAAVIMSLVEEGRIDLDAPIATYLAVAREPGAVTGDVRVRNLLTHTSGVRDVPCQTQPWVSPQDCARTLVRTPLEFPADSAVAYGNGPWHLAGLLVLEVTGVPFEELFRQRVGDPLGLTSIDWGGGPNTGVSGSLATTVDDYTRFLEMIVGGGTTRDGVTVLSRASVADMVSNQLVHHGPWLGGADLTTGITAYGIGMWLDELDDSGCSVIISGNASRGFYPWIDFATGTYGVVGVDDPRGADLAVPQSQKVAHLAIAAARAH